MADIAHPSPFFQPSTPQLTVEQQTPGGRRVQVQKKVEVEEQKSGLVGCAANLVNAIVGSGIVGIPYAIKQSGFLAGIVLVILCAFLTEKSLRLLVATAKHVHCPSYETTAEAAFGVAGFRFVAINMLIMAYGAMLSYLMIVKECFSALFGVDPENVPVRRSILLVISLAVQFPLSTKRDMADLAFTSRLSVIIDTLLVFFVACNAPWASSLERIGGTTGLFQDVVRYDTLFVGLGVLSFAFVCQHSAFIIAGSLEKPTIARWSIVTKSALALCGFLALLCGVSGYVGFLDETRGNVLQNLPSDSWTASVARAMLGCTMLFVYPLESFVARHVCVVLLFAGRRAHEGDDSTILNRRDRRVGLTALLYLSAVIPAAIFDDLGPVLAVSGAIGGSSLSYIGPGLVFLGVHGDRFINLVEKSWFADLVAGDRGNTGGPRDAASRKPNEETPLIDDMSEEGVLEKVDDNEVRTTQVPFFIFLTKWCTWYLCGMPIWYFLAQQGRNGLEKHARDMAMRSPHPIRIGDVEYSSTQVTRLDQRETVDDLTVNDSTSSSLGMQLTRHNSLVGSKSDPSRLPASSPAALRLGKPPPCPPIIIRAGVAGGGVGINQMLGKELLKLNKQEKKKVFAVEKDPQEAPATIGDFGVAIFYMLLGLLALVAGIVSLTASDTTNIT